MDRKHRLMITALLAFLPAAGLYAAECHIKQKPAPRRIELPPLPPLLQLHQAEPEKVAEPAPETTPLESNSQRFTQALIDEADTIFTAEIVEVIGTNAFTSANDDSKNFLAHVWVKQGWKKPKRRKLDLEIDFQQTACQGALKVQLNFYDKYLFFLSGDKVLSVLPLKKGQPSSLLGMQMKQQLGEEDWYYNRVDNLVMVSQSL